MAQTKQSSVKTHVSKTAETEREPVDLNNAVAVLTSSKRFERDIWLAFNDHWQSDDDLPVFYASELQFIKDKSQAEMNKIMEVKTVFKGSVVRKG